MNALLDDIKINLQHTDIDTIYIGGGTPSLLSVAQLQQIVDAITVRSNYQPTEITLEANPESLVTYNPEELLQTGINRLSLGIQSWQPTILEKMGRYFDIVAFKQYINKLRKYGLHNLNLDHIIAFPSQTVDMLDDDIQQTLSLQPEHISIYPLEVHPRTLVYQQLKTHQLVKQSSADVVKQFSTVQLTLQQHGYRHYEELNFSKPGYECLHNVHFWQGNDYVGFGPGSVGHVGLTITENLPDVNGYINGLHDGNCSLSKKTIMTNQQQKLIVQDLKMRLLNDSGGI